MAALSSDGTIWTWGSTSHMAASYGGLGRDATQPGLSSYTPGQVQAVYGVATPFSGVAQIAVGGSAFGYMCAIVTDNSVWCWGHNLVGQLGVGDTTQRNQPTRISQTYVGQTLTLQSDAFTALSLIMGPYDRYTYMCAIRMDRTLWCWGYNTRGNLGTGDTTQRNAPSKVKGTWNVNIREVALKTGNSYDGSYDIFGTSCALTFSGTVWCWGWGSYGTIGNGRYVLPSTNSYNVWDPQQVWALSNIRRIWMRSDAYSSGATTTMYALDDDGVTVWCWGFNGGGSGYCGTGDTFSTTTVPMRVPELRLK